MCGKETPQRKTTILLPPPITKYMYTHTYIYIYILYIKTNNKPTTHKKKQQTSTQRRKQQAATQVTSHLPGRFFQVGLGLHDFDALSATAAELGARAEASFQGGHVFSIFFHLFSCFVLVVLFVCFVLSLFRPPAFHSLFFLLAGGGQKQKVGVLGCHGKEFSSFLAAPGQTKTKRGGVLGCRGLGRTWGPCLGSEWEGSAGPGFWTLAEPCGET